MGKPWEQRKLEDMFNMSISNNTLSRSNLTYEVGEIHNIHYGDILIKYGPIIDAQKEEIPYIISSSSDKYKNRLLQDGDIIFADTAEDETTGKAVELRNLKDKRVVAGLHTIVCRPIEKMAKYYLGFYLNSDSFHKQLLPLMQGIKVLSLTRNNLSQTLIKFPQSIAEQEKIGSIFYSLEKLISLHQQQLDLLKEQKKGLLQKMFPKDGSNVPELRFPEFISPWEQRKLKEIAIDIKDGTHGSHKDEAGSGFFLLSAKNIKEGKLIYSPEDRQISKKDFELINKPFFPQKHDILLTIVGSIGESTVLENSLNIAFQRSVAFIRTQEEIQPEFISISLQTNRVQQYLEDHKSVSAQPGIYLSELEKLPILLPTFQEQTRISGLFKLVDTSITLHQRQLDLLKEQKKGLLQKMFPKEGEDAPKARFPEFK